MPRDNQRITAEQPQRRVQDLPGCIKYVLLFFLVLLLLAELFAGEYRPIFSREFNRVGGLVWIILLIKLLLIALLIWLIRVQRQLNCTLTGPSGCAIAE